MDVHDYILFTVENFVCLERNKYPVSDSVCFDDYFGRG